MRPRYSISPVSVSRARSPLRYMSRSGRGGKWICEEALGGQFIPLQVAARDALAGDTNFSDNARRDGIQLIIDKINLEVRNRDADDTADGTVQILPGDGAVRGMHCCLRDAVHIDDNGLLVAVDIEPRLEALQFQGLAGANHEAQIQLEARGRVRFRPDQLPESGGRLIEHRDALARKQLVKTRGRTADQIRHNDEAPSMQQRSP